MYSGKIETANRRNQWLVYLSLPFIGVFILFLGSLIQHTEVPAKGEYFYSQLLRNNLTLLSHLLFFIAAGVIGFFTALKPILAGGFLFLIFPLTSVVEASVYRGSHNLIPFEFVVFLLMAVPSVIACYIGRYFKTRIPKAQS